MTPGFLLSLRMRAHAKHVDDQRDGRAYWAEPSQQLLYSFLSSEAGLTSVEAVRRRAVFGPNALAETRSLSRLRLFAKQLASPLLWLLAFAALTSALTGEWMDAGVVTVVLMVSVGIGYRRERAAALRIEPLQARIRTQARVLRDGTLQRLPVDVLVPGDVVELAAGSLVPADCVVLRATDLQVNQAVLTGESYPVHKQVGPVLSDTPTGARSNCVLFGTNVRSGSATCLVVHTGRATQFGALAARLVQKAPETEFERGTRRFGYLLTVTMLCIVIAVFGVHALEGRPAIETLLFAIALAVGLSPELLPVILNVNLARGAESLAARGVLVRRLAALENLGSMDVLCTDKTGTLTEGVVALQGAFGCDGESSKGVLLLARYNAQLSTGFVNPLDEAIERVDPAPVSVRKVFEFPFDFVRKRASVIIEHDGRPLLITKGAVHSLLDVCTTDARDAALDDEQRAGWGLALMVVASAPAGLGCRDARSTSAPTSPCAHLAAANARVDDVEGGVSLQLRVPDSGLDVITLQDYVSHLVNAWNEAERGVAARCSPVVRTSAGLTSVPSFAVQSALPDGVQLVFKPVVPGQLDALREYVHHQEQRTISCACEPARRRPLSVDVVHDVHELDAHHERQRRGALCVLAPLGCSRPGVREAADFQTTVTAEPSIELARAQHWACHRAS